MRICGDLIGDRFGRLDRREKLWKHNSPTLISPSFSQPLAFFLATCQRARECIQDHQPVVGMRLQRIFFQDLVVKVCRQSRIRLFCLSFGHNPFKK
jgi:hypothetical protein